MAKRKLNSVDFFLIDIWSSLDTLIRPYAQRIKERMEIMQVAQEKRTAPYEYLRMLKEIAPRHPADWRAGDMLFLEHYQKDSGLYQKLLQIRKEYFNGQKP